MPVTGLDRCPACSRELDEAVPPGGCPDCGLHYDEHSRVWRSGESWARLAVVYAAVGLAAGLAVALLYRLGLDRAPDPTMPLACALLAPGLGLLLRRGLTGRVTGRFVALTPGGILVGTRARPMLVAWSDFDRLTEQRGVPKLQLRSGPAPLPLDDIFSGAEEVAAFRSELKQAAKRYGPAAPAGRG